MNDKLLQAITGALIALFAMVGLLVVFRRLGYAITPDTAYLSAVFVALLVLALLSGRLTEFSFGGFSAKFQAAANAPAVGVDIAGSTLHPVPKVAVANIPNAIGEVRGKDAVAIEMRLSNDPNQSFSSEALFEYARAFSAVTANPLVMVVDDRGGFVGAAEASRIASLHPYVLHPELPGGPDSIRLDSLIAPANANDVAALRKLPFLQTNKAKVGISNIDALKKMQDANVDFLVLVDDQDRPVKVATRQQIVEHLLLALAT